jgi:N-acyl homoserine lactone hydrolase
MPNPVLHKNIVEQLADLGLQPDDIDTLICTHLDMDHTGHSGAFTKAVRYIQRAHYEQAIEDPRFHHLRAEWDVPTEKYVLLDGDYELVPGFRLIETSGHRRGHQSVLLHLPQTGAVLLIIDAVPHRALFTPDRPLTPADDQDALEAVQASARKLLAIAEQEQPLVIFGHDGSQWSELEKTPECYR